MSVDNSQSNSDLMIDTCQIMLLELNALKEYKETDKKTKNAVSTIIDEVQKIQKYATPTHYQKISNYFRGIENAKAVPGIFNILAERILQGIHKNGSDKESHAIVKTGDWVLKNMENGKLQFAKREINGPTFSDWVTKTEEGAPSSLKPAPAKSSLKQTTNVLQADDAKRLQQEKTKDQFYEILEKSMLEAGKGESTPLKKVIIQNVQFINNADYINHQNNRRQIKIPTRIDLLKAYGLESLFSPYEKGEIDDQRLKTEFDRYFSKLLTAEKDFRDALGLAAQELNISINRIDVENDPDLQEIRDNYLLKKTKKEDLKDLIKESLKHRI